MPKVCGIEFEEKGKGYPPIICLHGIGGDSNSFFPQLEGLSANFRIISWNMPGYRNSDFIENLTFEILSKCLFDFIQALDIKKCHLIGQSIGGMIAQEFSLRYPDIIESLVLIATTSAFGGKTSDFKKKFMHARLYPLDQGKKMSELAESTIPKIVGSKVDKKTIKIATKSMSNIPEKTFREILKCLVTFDRYDEINKLSIPCCLLAGQNDNNAPAKTMEKMSKKIKYSKFYEFDNVGHLVNIEEPKKTNKIILNFINSLNR